jgi:hypothetical protein
MKPPLKQILTKALFKLDPPYPADDLIRNYADFRRVRDLLPVHQFNPLVFEQLLQLTLDNWHSKKRISRLSLVTTLYSYLYAAKVVQDGKPRISSTRIAPDRSWLPPAIADGIFRLFRKSLEETAVLTASQIPLVQRMCNSVARGLAFRDEDVYWLLDHAHLHPSVLNRLLRYPVRSAIISNWVTAQFLEASMRLHRIHSIGWMLDANPDFEVDTRLIEADFEFMNQLDSENLKRYNEEMKTNDALNREFNDIFQTPDPFDLFADENGIKFDAHLERPQLIKRHYRIPSLPKEDYFSPSEPDFDALRKEFLPKLSYHQRSAMIWGITLSRLDQDEKNGLYKKYFDEDTAKTLLHICKTNHNKEMLQWMWEQV